jgi:E3 ubiquitin-protein ligase synoviolin
MLYSDLILGFFRVVLYMIFMIVMMKIHTFPLFAIRPMFIAMK